jgi:hypothetical protein
MGKKGLPVQGYFNRARVFGYILAAFALFVLLRYLYFKFIA